MEQRLGLSVSVGKWNGKETLKKRLKSVCVYGFGFSQFIVVDSASEDGSLLSLGRIWPQVRLVDNVRNGGLAKANN